MGMQILTNARMVLADEIMNGTVAFGDDVIRDLCRGRAAVAAAEDLEGDFLLPGLVELHTDHLESHFAPRPGVRWDPLAAVQAHDAQIAGCGITTVFDALRAGTDHEASGLGDDMKVLAEAIRCGQEQDRLRADHFIHLRCEISAPDVVDDMAPFIGDRLLRLVSVMDHTPGQRQFASLDKYREYYQGKSGLSDAAMETFIAQRLENHARHALAGRAAVIEICRCNRLVLASHDDATEAHIEEAVAAGVAIAEFPTTGTAAAAARRAGLSVLMGAPNVVRGGSHSGNVAAGDLAARGLLDILSSDYVPISLIGAAFALPQQVEGMTLPQAVRLVTRNPARAVGFDDRGEIAIGKRADLVRVRFDGSLPAVRAVWRSGKRIA
jgi:alpha-D-ribose 1-methylphosphonate 5-triphosphate diphosphatase